jgi:mono/diheme cytochrome c family protein
MRSLALFLCAAAMAQSPKYGAGRPPSSDEIRQWDISVRPDGKGLPAGKGSVADGQEIFANRCSKCHGSQGQGRDAMPLVGGRGTLNSAKPLKTVESYWPYATTVFDYIHRAMPFNQPGTLSTDQVYAVTAYVLFLARIVPENAVMDENSLPKVRMPNRDGFVRDPRPDVKKPGPQASVRFPPEPRHRHESEQQRAAQQ